MRDNTHGVRDEEKELRKRDKRRGTRDYTQGVRDEERSNGRETRDEE